MYAIGTPLLALVSILDSILFVYTIIVVASAVLSWVNPDPYNPIVRTLYMLTEPVYKRLRRYVPTFGAVDLTPLVLILIIMFIQQGILPVIGRFAYEKLGAAPVLSSLVTHVA